MSKEEVLAKIKETKIKVAKHTNIDEIIKDINDILEYFKQDNVWIEYCKLNQLFIEEYDTCLLANVGDNKK